MSRIWVRDFLRDYDNPIADGIIAYLRDDMRIFREDLYDIDVAARAEKHAEEEVEEDAKEDGEKEAEEDGEEEGEEEAEEEAEEDGEEEVEEHAESAPPPPPPADFLLEFKLKMQNM